MVTTEKEAPILVAEFPGEGALWAAVQALEECRIGRDFIGVLIGEDGHGSNGHNGHATIHLVSVLAPSRLHEEVRAAFARCGADAIGAPGEIVHRHGVIPHPGALEDHGMKLSMGREYPDARRSVARPRERR